jgi:predicted exporter
MNPYPITCGKRFAYFVTLVRHMPLYTHTLADWFIAAGLVCGAIAWALFAQRRMFRIVIAAVSILLAVALVLRSPVPVVVVYILGVVLATLVGADLVLRIRERLAG